MASNLRPIAQLTAILLRATVIVAVSPAVSREHRLECPAEAPIEWGMAKRAPLDGPAVLAQPTGLPINDQSPPLLVPDRGYAHDGVWHNVWIIGEEAGWTYFVDCRYRTSARVLRLGADGLRQCEQTAEPYNAKGGIAADAKQTMICD